MEARRLLEALQERFASCGLQLHPQKTQIVYCRDGKRRAPYLAIQFTFLGYTFRPRMARSAREVIFTSFLPAASPQALKRMRAQVKAMALLSLVHLSIEEIARMLNPVLQGWIQYYGRFYRTELIRKLYRYLDHQIAAWLRRKYKQLRSRWGRSWQLLKRIRQQRSGLFAHWRGAGVVASG